MFNMYIVWYLFLAGTGSGAYALAALFSFIGRRFNRDDLREYRIISGGGFWLGPLLVAFSAVFLIFDLGSPEKAISIFLTPKLSILNVGSWALLLFCLLACFSLFLHTSERVEVARSVLSVVEVLTLLAALAVMTYTGVLVSSFKAVPFLYSPLVIILFIISSFSAGAAIITLYGFFNQHRKAMRYGLPVISRIDVACIAFEVIVLTGLFIQKTIESEIAQSSVQNILFGEGFLVFWVCLVGLGIALPVILTFISRKTPQPISAVTWAISAMAILVGSFALRYCLLIGGLRLPVEVLL